MAVLDPAIYTSMGVAQMAGSSPAMTVVDHATGQ
jgi:hypothetical protein